MPEQEINLPCQPGVFLDWLHAEVARLSAQSSLSALQAGAGPGSCMYGFLARGPEGGAIPVLIVSGSDRFEMSKIEVTLQKEGPGIRVHYRYEHGALYGVMQLLIASIIQFRRPAPAAPAVQKNTGGRPPNLDDEWARQEIFEKGRNRQEVKKEWLARIGSRLHQLADPDEAFTHMLSRYRRRGALK